MLIQRLRTQPAQKVLLAVAGVSLLGVLTVGALLLGIARQLDPDPLRLEFTWSAQGARRLLAQWSADEVKRVRQWVWLDFPFLAAYVAQLGSLCLLTARARRGALATLGLRLAVLALVAGLLDVLENVCMLLLLKGPPEAPGAGLAAVSSVAASVKFALVIGCALYVLVGGLPVALARLWRAASSRQ